MNILADPEVWGYIAWVVGTRYIKHIEFHPDRLEFVTNSRFSTIYHMSLHDPTTFSAFLAGMTPEERVDSAGDKISASIAPGLLPPMTNAKATDEPMAQFRAPPIAPPPAQGHIQVESLSFACRRTTEIEASPCPFKIDQEEAAGTSQEF